MCENCYKNTISCLVIILKFGSHFETKKAFILELLNNLQKMFPRGW